MSSRNRNNAQTSQEQQAPESAAVFRPAGLRSLGAGMWVYRHEGERPEGELADFFNEARQNFGMRDNDCVTFIAGKKAELVVV